MRIEQTDLAHLSDDECKLIALAAHRVVDTMPPGPLAEFWRGFVVAMTRAVKQRRIVVLQTLQDLDDDDEEGGLAAPGSDPVGEALAELRRPRRPRRWLR